MPDFISHILCAEEVHNKIMDLNIKNQIEKRKNLYYFGSQGPDPFFYCNFFPFMNNEEEEKIARRMHSKKTGEFFIKALKYLRNLNKNEYYDFLSYMFGMICHFALDKNAHPYIYYIGGFKEKINDEYHKKIEIKIDDLLLKRKKNISAQKFKTYNCIKLKEDFPQSIKNFYQDALYSLYGIKTDGSVIEKSHREMYCALRLLYDPLSIKWTAIKLFNCLTSKDFKYNKNIYHSKDLEGYDFLNLNKRVWKNPCTGCESSESFIDLYNKAIDEALELINKSLKYLKGDLEENTLKEIFKDISYLTGVSEGNCMKFQNCIFEKDDLLI